MYEIILRFDRYRAKDKTRLRAWYLTLGLKNSLSNYDEWSPEIERLSPNKIRYLPEIPMQFFQYPTSPTEKLLEMSHKQDVSKQRGL